MTAERNLPPMRRSLARTVQPSEMDGSEDLEPGREPLPAAYTVDEVAAHFSVDRSTICDAIKRGDLKAGRVGRRYFVLPSAITEWCSRVCP